MRNAWILTAANLRKNKGQTISLILFILIAALLLNIGLVITPGIGSFFDKQAELKHTPHFTGVYTTSESADSLEQGQRFLAASPDVSETEALSAVGGWGNYYLNDQEMQGLLIFSRVEEKQTMDPLALIGEYRPLTDDAVYIPYTLMLSGGYRLGDTIKFKFDGSENSFTVAGATEEIMFGSQLDPFFRIYLADEKWNSLKDSFPQNGLTLLSARLKPGMESAAFQTEYNRNVSKNGLLFGSSYQMVRNSRVSFTTIAAAMIVVFSLVLLMVSLIVIRFRIMNSIEESMTNIGIQKAVGYRSIQIISSIILQFASSAFLGGIMGTALSQALIPLMMKLWEPMLGLIWNPGFDAIAAASSVAVVTLTAVIVSWLAASRINRLHPLSALRGGIRNHSFSKNKFRLDRARGPLMLLLALKQVSQTKKRTAGIALIIATVTMASVIGLALNYNMTERRAILARSIFGEIPNIDILTILKDENENEAFKARMTANPEVRKIFGFTGNSPTTLNADGMDVSFIAVEDCSLMEGKSLTEGRYPKHDNEIAVSYLVLRAANKKIGDTVTIGDKENHHDYLITGTVQSTEGGGVNGLITGAGMRLLQPGFQFSSYAIYLKDGVDPKQFIETLQTTEGDIFDVVIEEQNQVNTLIDSVSGIFSAVAAAIWAATIFVIILVLYMILKTMILRQQRELGIQKAVGFTTFQLMNQIALNMTPVILLGVLLGAVAGSLSAAPVFVAMFRSMGITKLQLVIPIEQAIILSIALVLLAYLVSMLIAWRIRKISAYALVTE